MSLMFLVACSREGGEVRFASVGTGSVTGVYYQAGQAIMTVMNERTAETGLKITAEATGGSVANINAILAGDMEVGVSQSDSLFHAYNGQGEWQDKGPQTALRVICSLHAEAITVVATDASGIRTLADVGGKTINIGNPGSGQRQNALDIFQSMGIDPERDFRAEGLKASEAPKVLQDGQIDAFFYTVGHPAAAILEATSGRRPVRFVPIDGKQDFLEKFPYYVPVAIPIAFYPNAVNKEDVGTIGMLATLVTSEAVDEETIYQLTKGIFENLDRIRELHEAFRGLDARNMVGQGAIIPRHPGAERYYREAGLLN
jgi:TRAP transporter TAXI family solute receptor